MRYHQSKGGKKQVKLHRKAAVFNMALQVEPCFCPSPGTAAGQTSPPWDAQHSRHYGFIVTAGRRDHSSVSSVKQEEWSR